MPHVNVKNIENRLNTRITWLMLRTMGIISVNKSKGRVSLDLCRDFCKYYIWHIQRYFKIQVAEPLYGPHVSLALPDFDKKVDWNATKKCEGVKVDIEYLPDIIVGGRSRNFRNFYINFESDDLYTICYDIGTNRTTRLFHCTLANTKSLGFKDFWPEMIRL